jgi:hypothetical protein
MSRAFISSFATFALVACSTSPKASIYLYPGAKVEVTEGDLCAVHESLTSDTLTPVSPDRSSWTTAHTVSDQSNRQVLSVSPCNS